MKTRIRRTYSVSLWVFLAIFVLAGCNKEGLSDLDATASEEMELKRGQSAQNQIIAEIRKATAKYHDFDVAFADGYELDPHCVEHPDFGGMGFHAVNMGRIGPFVNPAEPGVLVYEPTEDGRHRLVAAEFLVPAGPWDNYNDGPPMLGEVPFDDHRKIILVEKSDENGNLVYDEYGNVVLEPKNAKGGPPFPHYQLHVWVWKNNPLGMYFPFNPKVSCEFAGH